MKRKTPTKANPSLESGSIFNHPFRYPNGLEKVKEDSNESTFKLDYSRKKDLEI